MTNTPSSSTLSRGLATRWGRMAAGTVMVVGAMLAASSAMNAWAERPAGPRGGFMHAAHHAPGLAGGPMAGLMLGGPRLDKLLDEVQASETQRAQIRQIAGAARDDLRKLHADAPDLRGQSLSLMTQPKVDATAAEQLRQKMLAQHDAVSKRTLTAMLDIAKVLTPEQRAQLGEKFKQRQAEREQRRQQWHERHQGAAPEAATPAATR